MATIGGSTHAVVIGQDGSFVGAAPSLGYGSIAPSFSPKIGTFVGIVCATASSFFTVQVFGTVAETAFTKVTFQDGSGTTVSLNRSAATYSTDGSTSQWAWSGRTDWTAGDVGETKIVCFT
jgi:hypothetical protein